MFKMGCSMARKILAIDGKGTSNQGEHQQGASSSSSKHQAGKDKQLASGGNNSDVPTKTKTTEELNDFSKLEDDPRIPLNVRQIFKITKSWKAIARTMSKTGTAMFLNLFEQNQDLFYLFDRFQHLKGKELHESMELREHAATVMSTLDQSINSLSDYDNFVNYLHSIGKLHRKVPGFKRAYFWKIEQPFLKAVKQTLDERCNETIEEIYKIAIKLILETIADGYGEDQPDSGNELDADRDKPASTDGNRRQQWTANEGDKANELTSGSARSEGGNSSSGANRSTDKSSIVGAGRTTAEATNIHGNIGATSTTATARKKRKKTADGSMEPLQVLPSERRDEREKRERGRRRRFWRPISSSRGNAEPLFSLSRAEAGAEFKGACVHERSTGNTDERLTMVAVDGSSLLAGKHEGTEETSRALLATSGEIERPKVLPVQPSADGLASDERLRSTLFVLRELLFLSLKTGMKKQKLDGASKCRQQQQTGTTEANNTLACAPASAACRLGLSGASVAPKNFKRSEESGPLCKNNSVSLQAERAARCEGHSREHIGQLDRIVASLTTEATTRTTTWTGTKNSSEGDWSAATFEAAKGHESGADNDGDHDNDSNRSGDGSDNYRAVVIECEHIEERAQNTRCPCQRKEEGVEAPVLASSCLSMATVASVQRRTTGTSETSCQQELGRRGKADKVVVANKALQLAEELAHNNNEGLASLIYLTNGIEFGAAAPSRSTNRRSASGLGRVHGGDGDRNNDVGATVAMPLSGRQPPTSTIRAATSTTTTTTTTTTTRGATNCTRQLETHEWPAAGRLSSCPRAEKFGAAFTGSSERQSSACHRRLCNNAERHQKPETAADDKSAQESSRAEARAAHIDSTSNLSVGVNGSKSIAFVRLAPTTQKRELALQLNSAAVAAACPRSVGAAHCSGQLANCSSSWWSSSAAAVATAPATSQLCFSCHCQTCDGREELAVRERRQALPNNGHQLKSSGGSRRGTWGHLDCLAASKLALQAAVPAGPMTATLTTTAAATPCSSSQSCANQAPLAAVVAPASLAAPLSTPAATDAGSTGSSSSSTERIQRHKTPSSVWRQIKQSTSALLLASRHRERAAKAEAVAAVLVGCEKERQSATKATASAKPAAVTCARCAHGRQNDQGLDCAGLSDSSDSQVVVAPPTSEANQPRTSTATIRRRTLAPASTQTNDSSYHGAKNNEISHKTKSAAGTVAAERLHKFLLTSDPGELGELIKMLMLALATRNSREAAPATPTAIVVVKVDGQQCSRHQHDHENSVIITDHLAPESRPKLQTLRGC